jgi:hypothetical protein
MKKTLPRPTYVGPILETSQAQAITHVPSTRTRIIVSRYVLVMSLIGGLILFGYAGAEIGFLIGGLALVLIGYAVFEMFLRMGQSNLTSTLAGALALTFMFATDLSQNVIGNSIRVGESLQKIAHAGALFLLILFLSSLFMRRR